MSITGIHGGGSGGRRRRFSDRESETRGGIRLEATASGESGRIEIDVEVSSPSFLPGPEISTVQQTVKVRPTGFEGMKKAVRRIPGKLSRRTDISRSFIGQAAQTQFPDPSDFIFSRTIRGASQLPESFEFGPVRFTPATIPDVGGRADDFVDDLPSVTITVESVASGFFGRWAASLPSVELEIPGSAFVQVASVDDFPCEEMFSDIESDISRLQQRMSNVEQLSDDIRDLENIRDEITSRAPSNRLSNITLDDLTNVNRPTVRDWEQRARIAEVDPIPGGGTIDSLSSLADRVENRVDDMDNRSCRSQFSGSIGDIQDQIDDLRQQSQRARNLKQQILNALEAGSIQVPQLETCADVPRFINNAVSGVEEEARSFSRARSASRTESRLRRIESNIDDTRNLVRDSVQQSECVSQLMNRLDSAEDTLESVGAGIQSCDAEYPSLETRIESFEDAVLDVDPPISAESFEILSSQADRVLDDVDRRVSEDRCIRQFTRRVDGALNRVASLGARVRIATELSEEEIAERTQRVQELRGKLQDIQARGRGGR